MSTATLDAPTTTVSERMAAAETVADLLGEATIGAEEARLLLRVVCPHLDAFQLERMIPELAVAAVAAEKADTRRREALSAAVEMVRDGELADARGKVIDICTRLCVRPDAVTN